MSIELYSMLYVILFQIVSLVVLVGGEWLVLKNKKTAKKIAERLGFVCLGLFESTIMVLLCWLFG